MTDWSAILRDLPPELVLVHELGLPHDPSSIWGQERLSLRPDGWLRLDVWQRDQRLAWEGRVDPALVRRWATLLARGGFPSLPAAPMSAGASFRAFEAKLGDQSTRALLSRYHFESKAPWETLCAIADSLCAQVRGRVVWVKPDPAAGALSAVRQLE